MITLIRLEVRRSKIRTYVIASLVIGAAMLCMLYLFAYAPMLEPDDADMVIFSGYDNMIPLFGVLNMAVFSVLAAVMYTKFIIEDYSGKRPVLIFSYPVSRKKIMLSKLCIVSLFTAAAMVISNAAIYLIFAVTERFLHLVSQPLTPAVLYQAAETTVLMSLTAAGTGIIAVGIGFIKKSVPTTIVSALLISSLMCNLVAGMEDGRLAAYTFTVIMAAAGVATALIMMHKVNVMEAE